MGLFDDFDESAKIGSGPRYKGGTYFVLMTGVAEAFNDPWRFLRVAGVVLGHPMGGDMGDSNKVGEEVEQAIFKKPKDKFFEKETRLLVKAARNLDREQADALSKESIGKFLLGGLLVGRVLEIKAQEVERKDPEVQKKKGSIVRVTPIRCLTKAEAMSLIPVKVLKRFAPNGIKEPKVVKS